MDSVAVYIEDVRNLTVVFAGKAILAIIVLLVGLWLIKRFRYLIERMFLAKNLDENLRPFLASIVSVILKVILAISVISILGVETTSFIALLGSAGLAIGLALQGSLSNFAGGVLILTLKPFKKGDFIRALGENGTVQAINIFNTVLKTPDNQVIFMPNGQLASATITNFSIEDTRRLVINFSISYKDDIPTVKQIVRRVIDQEQRILQDPEPQVIVTSWEDSAIQITARVWCRKEDFWNVNFHLNEAVKLTFDKEGISIPFPQRDIHVFQKH
jgi:small conductance mechanosensitive channel